MRRSALLVCLGALAAWPCFSNEAVEAQAPTARSTRPQRVKRKRSTRPPREAGLDKIPARFSRLSEVPVGVGGVAFNELNNALDSHPRAVVAWGTKDLRVTTAGRVTATFETTYEGTAVPYPPLKDFLFVQVAANYLYPYQGDFHQEPLTGVVPLVAQRSSEKSAQFTLDTAFRIPPMVKDKESGLLLWGIGISLTWVRVYRGGGKHYFHVWAGDSSHNLPPAASAAFDQAPVPLAGRFLSYKLLPEEALGGSYPYDYRNWVRDHIR